MAELSQQAIDALKVEALKQIELLEANASDRDVRAYITSAFRLMLRATDAITDMTKRAHAIAELIGNTYAANVLERVEREFIQPTAEI